MHNKEKSNYGEKNSAGRIVSCISTCGFLCGDADTDSDWDSWREDRANGVIMVLLYMAGAKEAYAISVARVLLSGFLFGNLMMILYSMAGGMLSLTLMILLKKIGGFSPIGVSVAGGVSHNVGQLVVAILVLETGRLIYYFPVLLLSGTTAGVLIGIVVGEIIKRLPKN